VKLEQELKDKVIGCEGLEKIYSKLKKENEELA